MANGSNTIEGIDGLDQWPHFSQNKSGIRSEMLYGIGGERDSKWLRPENISVANSDSKFTPQFQI